MAWTTPRTWTTGELVTAALLNTHIRDNELYLKGRFDNSAGHVHDGSTADAGPKVDADKLDGEHGSYYASASALSSHTGAGAAVHGLGSGVYVLGCKQGSRRIEYASVTQAKTDVNTLSVTWANAFSTIYGCVFMAYVTGGAGSNIAEWRTGSRSTTGASLTTYGGSTGGGNIVMEAVGIGT